MRWMFLRALGLVYLFAFASLWVQASGLFGENGILPAADYLARFYRYRGAESYTLLPTIFWLGASDTAIHAVFAVGVLLSLALIAGWSPGASLFVLWFLYLSVVKIGQVFLAFQWDNLLLEVGFLAIFLAPWGWRLRAEGRERAPWAIVWLLRLLLFRLMFFSGVVKLKSGDKAWHNLSALAYHFETQPLPTWSSWFMHQMPLWIHKLLTASTLALELAVPWLIFAPRGPRRLACALLASLQIGIALTGNYGYFNILSFALCLVLLDDSFLEKVLPQRLQGWIRKTYLKDAPDDATGETGATAEKDEATAKKETVAQEREGEEGEEPSEETGKEASEKKAKESLETDGASPEADAVGGVGERLLVVKGWVIFAVVCFVLLVSGAKTATRAMPYRDLPAVLKTLMRWASPYRSINRYGLFAVMTKTRPEIILEGSQDGRNWKAYELPWKPGKLERRPVFVTPHMPRLDWQLWFAALGNVRRNPWVIYTMRHLQKGTPEVLALFAHNPFPDRPPRYMRATVYRYNFTNWQTRSRTGRWWRRQRRRNYLPVRWLERRGPRR